MEVPLESYPIAIDKESMLHNWLDSLPKIRSPKDVKRGWVTYYSAASSMDLADTEESLIVPLHILQLPCGCQIPKVQLQEYLQPKFEWQIAHNKCPDCFFQLFRPWNFGDWLGVLEPVDITTLKEEDHCCSMCREKYAEAIPLNDYNITAGIEKPEHILESPTYLPCGHIFGNHCLEMWLSPASEGGGNGNSCPMCRRRLFAPWSSQRNELYNELDDESDAASATARRIEAEGLREWLDARALLQRNGATRADLIREGLATHLEEWEQALQEEEFSVLHVGETRLRLRG